MWRDALLVAAKDLRIELRSKVVMNQVLPFAMIVLVMFAFALGPDDQSTKEAAAGLFWLAVLFASLLAVQRSVGVESSEGARDTLRLSGLDPGGVFLGKTAAVAIELAALESVLAFGVVVLYGVQVRHPLSMLLAAIAGTVGVASTGTLYGALSSGAKVRETLLPLLLLPVTAPVLLAGTQVWQAGMGTGSAAAGPWLSLLLVFAVVYLALGTVVFGPLQEAP